MFGEDKENRINYRINRSPLTREEELESRLLQKFGIQDSLHPAQTVSTTMFQGIKYYTKIHTSDEPVRIWNDLYGKNTGRFLRFEDAFYDNKNSMSYFPELGTSVVEHEPHVCNDVTNWVQNNLERIGYHHTDLYHKYKDEYGRWQIHHNCSNIRRYMDDYFAIDTEKIINLPNGGNKKRKTNKKLKKSKKTHNKKSKKAKKAKKSHNKKSKKSKK